MKLKFTALSFFLFITCLPIFGQTNWEYEYTSGLSREAYARNIGDIDRDGFPDFAVIDNGFLDIFYGSTNGPSSQPTTLITNSDFGGKDFTDFVSGNFNGDSFTDVVLMFNDEVVLLLGIQNDLEISNWSYAVSGDPGAAYEMEIKNAGDVNGDGIDDLIVGDADFGSFNKGRVVVFYGNSSGFETEPNWQLTTDLTFDYLGSSVSSCGDVNNDGYDDVYLRRAAKSIEVYLGSDSGLSQSSFFSASPSFEIANNTYFGFGYTSLNKVGDLNGDGFDDIVVGARENRTFGLDFNDVFIFYGSDNGISSDYSVAYLQNFNDEVSTRNVDNGYIASYISSQVDFNNDGFDDLILGYDEENYNSVQVFFGSINGIPENPDTIWGFSTFGTEFYDNVEGISDVNGDGFGDIIVTQYDIDKTSLFYGDISKSKSSISLLFTSNESTTVEGYVTSNGGGNITEYGFVYGLNENPTIGEMNVVQEAIQVNTDTFNLTLSNLSPNATYYFRSYSKNQRGISYSKNLEVFTNSSPSISDQQFDLTENSPVNTLIGIVQADDADGESLTYSILSGHHSNTFEINSSNGELILLDSSVVDYESLQNLEIEVSVSDGNTDPISARITINIIDRNEAPSVADVSFTIDENSAIGTSLGTPTSSDPENDDLTFSITTGNDHGAFQIDANTAEVTVSDATPLDFEINPTFEITIAANDGEFTSEATISVSLSDRNEAPSVTDVSFTIDENSAVGTSLGTLTSSDPENDDLTFSITTGNDHGAFQINANTAEVTVSDATPLDFETNPTFEITIAANDGELTGEATISVSLNDRNEAPSVADVSFTIDENSAIGTSLGTLTSSDPENDDLTFSITTGNDLGAFQIDANTAEVTVSDATPLDFETNPTFEIIIAANDGELTSEATISVSLSDRNEAPSVTDVSFTIDENSAIGTSLGTLTSSDPENDDLTFSITTGNDLGAFQIDANTAEVTVSDATPLDFETNPTFEITIAANDGELTSEATISVSLSDRNEAPSVTDVSFTIDENSAVGTSLGTLTSSDPENDDLTFSITTGNDLGAFQIDANTAEVTVVDSEPLDFETNSNFEYIVEVDDGEFTNTATISVSLNDINEAPSDIFISSDTISENREAGTLIGILSTEDEDGDESFTYSFPTENDLFEIAVDELLSKVEFDYEESGSHSLEITTTDNGGLSFSKTFDITIIDVEGDVLGLDELDDDVIIYPNPARDYLVIKWEKLERATVSDLSGRKLLRSLNRTLDLRALNTGVYLITLEGKDSERIVFRIMKE
ncbi:cadherin domain-containing protein [Ekhidna sp.]|uniref:cadherin domain-containing protein n=1 Tax=Ekhidna sp. TaxID=2608089 RepID=UPI003CCB7513